MLNSVINIDLHIHSAASSYKEAKGIVDESDSNHCDILLNALIGGDNPISLFSITDHNRFDSALYESMHSKIAERGLNLSLLSGVEFDVRFENDRQAAHVITIFDSKNSGDRSHIESCIRNNLLANKEESYSLKEYESLLKDIGLSTILIVHQHSGFNGDQKKRSLGRSTSNAVETYKFGYVDALEYNKPTVQGILKSELSDLHLPSRMLIGSDCHQWSAYPKHDSDAAAKESYFAQIKALPTFRGLLMALTSPETRIGSVEYVEKTGYVESINLCGEQIPLSPGINVIIGENGIGKSSVLKLISDEQPKEKWIKTLRSEAGFSCNGINRDLVEVIGQGQLQADYNKSGKIFDSSLFSELSNEEFESAVKTFTGQLKSRIKKNIESRKRRDLIESNSLKIEPELEVSPYSIVVSCAEDFTNVDNKWGDPKNNLTSISGKISLELNRGDAFYSKNEQGKLAEALTLVNEVAQRVGRSFADVDAEAMVKGIISNAIKNYDEAVKTKSSDLDNRRAEYMKKKRSVVDDVMWLLKDSLCDRETAKMNGLSKDAGYSSNPSRGFRFVRTAKYSEITDIEDQFLQRFNAGYKDKLKLESIDTEAEMKSAIPRCSDSWEKSLDELTKKFISELEEFSETIMDIDSMEMGNTLGEMALTYYRYRTSSQLGSTIFIVDQPEDNISNNRVNEYMTSYFNRLRNKSQVIMVTHSPLLVVNQDVDNVIVLSRGKNGKRFSVSYGCLESEDNGLVLEDVANIMDGGTEAIKRRVKAYGAIDKTDF